MQNLQNDFNETGEENFSFEVLDNLKPKEEAGFDYTEELKVREDMWLDKLQPYDEKGYNPKKK